MKEQDRQELIRYRITRALQTLEEVEVLVEYKLADTQALIPAAKAFIEKARELLEQ